jgi:hypothetical protein
MKYSDNIDHMIASILYLGTHTSYWARTPKSLAKELQLNESCLLEIFDNFRGIYRKSGNASKENGQHYYSLQARYAQREGMDISDMTEKDFIPPLDAERLNVVIDFVLKMADQEQRQADLSQSAKLALRTNVVATTAAIISAIAAIAAASIKQTPPPQVLSAPPAISAPAPAPAKP